MATAVDFGIISDQETIRWCDGEIINAHNTYSIASWDFILCHVVSRDFFSYMLKYWGNPANMHPRSNTDPSTQDLALTRNRSHTI